MQKVIGLDIGGYSIKAVEIVNTFKSYEITNFFETVVPSLENAPADAVIPICMEQLFVENDLHADRIVTAMPGQFISSRILKFNYSDPRKIEKSVLVELEDHVPFNMDDMIIDHQILNAAAGQAQVLAVMTRKTFLKSFLDLLKRINIDPKLIDIDSLAFYNLSSHMDLEGAGNIAMVDIGHDKTSICIMKNGVLKMFRSINLGGRYITGFLARDLETSFHEAQRIKHRVSRVLTMHDKATDVSEHERIIIERMTLASNAIIKELGRTFYSFKSWEKEPLRTIYLSGGTSRLRNFDRFLSEQLEVEVRPLRINESQLKISGNVSQNLEILPQSLAIGLRSVTTVKNHSQINLRRGEFAYVQNYEAFLKGAAIASKIVALVMTLLIATYLLKHYFYTNEIESLKEQYRKEFLASFPDMKKSVRGNVTFQKMRKDAEGRLRQGIEEKKRAIDEYRLANRGSGALRVLQEMSDRVPKETAIDVTLFDFRTVSPGVAKLQIKAETENFSTQAGIIDALKKVPSLKDVEEKSSGTKPGSEGKKIEFLIEANYEAVNSGKG